MIRGSSRVLRTSWNQTIASTISNSSADHPLNSYGRQVPVYRSEKLKRCREIWRTYIYIYIYKPCKIISQKEWIS